MYLFLPISALLYWLGFERGQVLQQRMHAVGNAMVLLLAASIPLSLFVYAVYIMAVHSDAWLDAETRSRSVGITYWISQAWYFVISLRIAHALSMRVWPAIGVTVTLAALSLVIQQLWPATLWYVKEPTQEPKPPMQISQELFESQNKLLQTQLDSLASQREAQHDVYLLTYAPYAPEDVFWKESEMVRSVIGQRFDAAQRGISLLNNPATTATHAWATPLNLQRALQAIAAKMNREQDVLLLYLTSHGAKDFKLASHHWPLQTDQLTPQQLAQMLEASGIQHRIIAVSACYSGGWIAPLQTDRSLIMTAADATNTSYGCGTRSELTYFGRAVFDEQLRNQTRSFEQAFVAAVPIIKKREKEAGKDDGFSNPQIFLGQKIRAVLQELEN
jgi:Peptidase C13 family